MESPTVNAPAEAERGDTLLSPFRAETADWSPSRGLSRAMCFALGRFTLVLLLLLFLF